MKRFALLGAAGYVAPKHMQAIREIGGDLVAICDPSDSVGVIDRYFPECEYFREIESLDRHLEKLRREDRGIDYLSICTPNYLHDAHCRMAMRLDADAICEKPVVLEPHNLDALREIERETQRRVRPIMQLRHSSKLQELREVVRHRTDLRARLSYYAFRGPWYDQSWKGDGAKSGGLICNIGIHALDMLLWLFGDLIKITHQVQAPRRTKLSLEMERADIEVVLSLNLKTHIVRSGGCVGRRILSINDMCEVDLSFGDLHTAAYQAIVDGEGLFLHDARPAIELASRLRHL